MRHFRIFLILLNTSLILLNITSCIKEDTSQNLAISPDLVLNETTDRGPTCDCQVKINSITNSTGWVLFGQSAPNQNHVFTLENEPCDNLPDDQIGVWYSFNNYTSFNKTFNVYFGSYLIPENLACEDWIEASLSGDACPFQPETQASISMRCRLGGGHPWSPILTFTSTANQPCSTNGINSVNLSNCAPFLN